MSKKEVVVDSKWLREVANLIHDGHTGKFLRLCTGTLQNGPDPVDTARPMHCGLGELYFQLTGVQPEEHGVNEDDVVEEVLNRTALGDPDEKAEEIEEKLAKALKKELRALGLDESAVESVVDAATSAAADSARDTAEDKAQEFRDVLHRIPDVNDSTGASCHGDDTTSCTPGDFKSRAKAVASILREAAALLP